VAGGGARWLMGDIIGEVIGDSFKLEVPELCERVMSGCTPEARCIPITKSR
jgi:hypothetical protein